MKSKKGTKNLKTLFLKKPKKEDLPELSIKTDITDLKKKDEEFMKYNMELEKLRAPFYRKMAESMGIHTDEIFELEKKEDEIIKNMESASGSIPIEPQPIGKPAESIPRIREGSATLADITRKMCKDPQTITVKICKERVCVEQPMLMTVDDISPANGSGCHFSKYGDNKFVANDGVSGYSYRSGLNYHRGCRSSSGRINILVSTELVEPSKVYRIGMTFKALPDPNNQRNIIYMNQTSACGWRRMFLVDSFGTARKYWDMQITSRTPGGPSVREVPSVGDLLAEDTRRCYQGGSHGCVYLGCGVNNTILGIENPSGGQVTVAPPIYKDYLAGTIFLLEASLSYNIRACGINSNAYVHYGLELLPFIALEACSYQYPETVCIHIPDYLPT